jgi:hypothetical protein
MVLEINRDLNLMVLLRPEDLELLLHHGALLVWLLLHNSGRVRDGARLGVHDGRWVGHGVHGDRRQRDDRTATPRLCPTRERGGTQQGRRPAGRRAVESSTEAR